MKEGMSTNIKYLEGKKEGRMKEGRNGQYNEIFIRKEGRIRKEGASL